MIQLPTGKNLEGVLTCSSNFIFCHYTVNHPNLQITSSGLVTHFCLSATVNQSTCTGMSGANVWQTSQTILHVVPY